MASRARRSEMSFVDLLARHTPPEHKDSHYSMPFQEFLLLMQEHGFGVQLMDVFESSHHPGQDLLAVLWHGDGILLQAQSYANELARAQMHYNLMFDQTVPNPLARTSSGHMHSPSWEAGLRIWVGDHDARNWALMKLRGLRKTGEFLPQWVERPWLRLITYEEDKAYNDVDALTEARIQRLSQHVRDAITPEEN